MLEPYGTSDLTGDLFDTVFSNLNISKVYHGFDAKYYPTDDHMRLRYFSKGYSFAGYYLPAPNHNDFSWKGKRSILQDNEMKWGLAILFVGQQDPNFPKYSHQLNNIHTQANCDMLQAVTFSEADEFPFGSTIYLDIENPFPKPWTMDTSGKNVLVFQYAYEWVDAIITNGHFKPGIYCWYKDYPAIKQALGANADSVRFWTTGGTTKGISDTKYWASQAPSDVDQSGVDGAATVWQVFPLDMPSDIPDPSLPANWTMDRDISVLADPSAP